MKEISGKSIVIVGGARSGVAASVLLKGMGAKVFVTDAGMLSEQSRQTLIAQQIPFEEGGHSERAKDAEFVVVSPGVPDEAPLIRHFSYTGIPVYSEMEVACWFNKSPLTAVTGSNGKTTTTSWLRHLWETASKQALIAGNIGVPVSDLVLDTAPDKDLILEVSSFQLDNIKTFRPRVSVILNITPDHLNRYQNKFKYYVASKMKIIRNQGETDFLIYNYDDPVLKEQIGGIGVKPKGPARIPFSLAEELETGAFIRDEHIVVRLDGSEEVLMHKDEVSLKGPHNLANSLAVVLAGRLNGVESSHIRESLRTFEGVEHRLEQVRILRGVRYINDSKATNVNAVWYALRGITAPVVLILGGQDKGNNYRELTDQIRKKVHSLIAIGEAKAAIREQISREALYYFEAETMAQAVQQASKQARKGEVVLLSPACASFDMFENYEHRGRAFKEAVMDLPD
ncbi:UDP-N-acetylmuramoylalanine--D-glutamate ligase [Cyclonatronum proteinivorum]|uniref:UDP-N-acetylmuramoylalanine--D-glutamate ligase n=1 Tax=Cyclonatronum proteinivorum TaxID=1457365 RepID=A0A345UIP3_9BACT|nr:UDP-N-acetylmuramoyl-L-alanine--D-glutamate ligase [Cyclonatronum proteinivorum]AXJ00345.1 UDP-N-acetylmuramoylalanine--D-glutamate ligase [Cyclonatronum proteinivorum]